MPIEIKRVYDAVQPSDGFRVLVDRQWPRGLAKADAEFELWLKDAAPSADLRRWFGHQPAKWPEFRERYFAELKPHRELLEPLVARAKRGRVTLLYAARETRYNNAAALKAYLEGLL